MDNYCVKEQKHFVPKSAAS